MRWGDFFQSWEREKQALAPAPWPAIASEELFWEITGEMIADKDSPLQMSPRSTWSLEGST